MLERREWTGALVTIDARGCQRAMAEASRAQGADYLLALKRTDNGPANRATIRHAALNLMRAIPEKASLNGKRKTAAGDENYLFNALTARYQ